MSAIATDELQGVPLREIPAAPWKNIGWSILLVLTVLWGSWEYYWRITQDFVPACYDGLGLWSIVYDRIEREPTGSIAMIGSSRILFDMELGVTPPLFFTPPDGGVFNDADEYARDETPAQRMGQRLSMLIEPYVGSYNADAAWFLILRRQEWWPVSGVH